MTKGAFLILRPLQSYERAQVLIVPEKGIKNTHQWSHFTCRHGNFMLTSEINHPIPKEVQKTVKDHFDDQPKPPKRGSVHIINAPMHLYFETVKPVVNTPQTISIVTTDPHRWFVSLLHESGPIVRRYHPEKVFWYGQPPVSVAAYPVPITPFQANSLIAAYKNGQFARGFDGLIVPPMPENNCTECGETIPPGDFWHYHASHVYCLTCFGLEEWI